MEKFQEPPIEQKPVARWTVCPPLDPHRIQGLSLQRKHGMVTARRRGGAVEPYIHRRWGSRGTVTSSAAGGPLPSRRPRRFIWAATEDRPTRTRRTGTESDARGNGMPCQPWFAAGEYREQSRPAGQGWAQCMHLVARWWCGCILASQQAVFFSLSFRYCFIFVPFCSCVFFLSLFYTSDISFFFPSLCRVKLDVGSCTYVDGILFQQVC